MNARPILFSGEMVRALLDGRKTQTRRIVKPQPEYGDAMGAFPCWQFPHKGERWIWPNAKAEILARCPYGKPGDLLWVRETWSGEYRLRDVSPSERLLRPHHDGLVPPIPETWYWADGNPPHGDWERPRPSIHMPRWASRITLEITDVRVERIQQVSGFQASCEGFNADGPPTCGGDAANPKYPKEWKGIPRSEWKGATQKFREYWDHLNAKRGFGWDANPWVWVLTFRPHLVNVDDYIRRAA